MDAVRCPECGDVRWSFFGFRTGTMPMTCELCGAEMLPERRRPSPIESRGPAAVVERRRRVVKAAGSRPTVPPAA